MIYFRKELHSNPIKLPTGHPVPFELVADDTGILATEDGYLISELRNAIARQVGGVYEIGPAEYEELKKNPPDSPSPPPWLNGQSLRQQLSANVVVEGKTSPSSAMAQAPKPAAPAPREGAPLAVPQNIPITSKVKRGQTAKAA